MVISSDHNLIPYPDQNHQVQAFHQKNTAVRYHPGRDTIGRINLFQQPHDETASRVNRFYSSAARYDAGRTLLYCEAYNVGRLVNIYA